MRLRSPFGWNRPQAEGDGSRIPYTPWIRFERFLNLGSEQGCYVPGEPDFQPGHAKSTIQCLKSDGARAVKHTIDVARSGRAAKPEPAVFALALAVSFGDTETRQAAFAALPQVCRSGSQLLQFAAHASAMRGWGRSMRRAVADWYLLTPVEDLTLQALKHQQHGGWTHRDVLRLAHPKPPSEAHRTLFKWITEGELTGPNPIIEAYVRLNETDDPREAARLVSEHRLTRDCVPSRLLSHPAVWEALLQDMPLESMLRNLANLTRVGLLTDTSQATKLVVEKLGNETLLRRARIHPVAMPLAEAAYVRGQLAWEPVPRIVTALKEAFRLALGSLEPTERRYVVALDVSGSMGSSMVGGTGLTAGEAAAALALSVLAAEVEVTVLAFAGGLKPLAFTRETTLAEAVRLTGERDFEGTDCAAPMIWAQRHRVEADVFIVLTDNETTFRDVHPVQAMHQYRGKTGIPARLAVLGMTSAGFALSDPEDSSMLDIAGFDLSVPAALRAFVADQSLRAENTGA